MDVIATLMLIVQTALEVTRVHVETDSVEMVLHVPTLMSATTHHVTIMHRVPMNQVASRAVATMDTVEMVLHVQVYVNSMALAQTMQFALWTKSEMSTVTVRVASLGILLSLVLCNVTTLMNAKPTHVTLVHLAPTTMVVIHAPVILDGSEQDMFAKMSSNATLMTLVQPTLTVRICQEHTSVFHMPVILVTSMLMEVLS